MNRLTPTPDQAVALAHNRDALRAYWLGTTMPAVATRWGWWNYLAEQAQSFNVSPSMVVGRDLAALNEKLNRDARQYALMVAALGSGRAWVQPWSMPGEAGPVLRLGIARRDGALGAVPALLAAWALAPTILNYAVGAVVAAGTFILADGWLSAREAEAEAAAALATTRAKSAEAVAEVAKVDPQAALALADALNKADMLAASPSALDRMMNAFAGVAEAVGTTAKEGAGVLPWLIGFYVLSKRKAS